MTIYCAVHNKFFFSYFACQQGEQNACAADRILPYGSSFSLLEPLLARSSTSSMAVVFLHCPAFLCHSMHRLPAMTSQQVLFLALSCVGSVVHIVY